MYFINLVKLKKDPRKNSNPTPDMLFSCMSWSCCQLKNICCILADFLRIPYSICYSQGQRVIQWHTKFEFVLYKNAFQIFFFCSIGFFEVLVSYHIILKIENRVYHHNRPIQLLTDCSSSICYGSIAVDPLCNIYN